MKVLMIVFILFTLSTLLIISNNNLALYDSDNLDEFSSIYSSWLERIFSNSNKVTGAAVGLDWLP